jgi:hypothetical protein
LSVLVHVWPHIQRRTSTREGNRQWETTNGFMAIDGRIRKRDPAMRRRPWRRWRSKPSIVYGKPFTLLEDEGKKTFEYQAGSWVPFALSIAECRQQSFRVDQLPQKVNRMTRYEIRRPVDQ